MNRVEKNINNIVGQRISVLGLGRSGVAIAKLANYNGAKVFISDNSTSNSVINKLKELNKLGIDGEIGGHSNKVFKCKLLVISPGVPADSTVVLKALELNIKVIGEIEFASMFTDSPIIAVTGSNGKSTTVSILEAMCQSDKVHGVLAGNVGKAFSGEVLDEIKSPDNKRVYILEISSFQMEFIDSFHPYISIFLNISPDHLDRHGSFEKYLSAKLRLAENQDKHDFVIYNADDSILVKELNNSKTKKITFSPKKQENNLYFVKNSEIFNNEYAKLVDLENIGLPGQHNLYNLLAAASGAYCIRISDDKIAKVIKSFTGIPHRLETVIIINRITFVNDSKATNIDAVKVAIASYNTPIILILGGIAKGNDFSELLNCEENVKSIIAYGDAKNIIRQELEHNFDFISTELLSDAVKVSYQMAEEGDTVLLSPGCASFDQFVNFEERGEYFSQWVKELEI